MGPAPAWGGAGLRVSEGADGVERRARRRPWAEEREGSDSWARSVSGRRNERGLRAERCAGSGELGSGSGPRGERSGVGLAALGRTRGAEGSWARVGFSWARDLGWVSRGGGIGPGSRVGLLG